MVTNDVGANQGVAYDGTHYYVTGGQGVAGVDGGINMNVVKYDSSFNLVQDKDCSFDNGGAHEQVNGIYYDQPTGHLFIGANNYSTTPHEGWIYEYDASDLSFVAAHDVGAIWSEGCTKYDGHWFVVSANSHTITEFDDNWDLVKVHNLPGNPPSGLYWQGIFVIDDVFYINYHEPQNALWALTFDGSDFTLANTMCETPTSKCTQSAFVWDGSVYWAERDTSESAVVRTDL